MQIPSELSNRENETLRYHMDDPDMDFEAVKNEVKKRVADTRGNAMILSWNDEKNGRFYPTRACGDGKQDVPPWIYYAQVRGSNLTVDVNDGDYIFMMLIF